MTALPSSEFGSSEEVTIESIPLERIQENPANPRKVFKGMDELVESVRARGVLQPILVRPLGNRDYQLVFGARRFRAAQRAGLKFIPAMVKDLGDPEALEIMIIENAKREDVHQLEEAQGYHQLHTEYGQDVATIAAKVGRSVAYVYDRMKLLSLTPKNQERFMADEFTAGHAILLARLDTVTQTEAVEALFTHEQLELGHDPEAKRLKSVRWLASWIDKHVKLDVASDDNLMLFPDMVDSVKRATEEAARVVHITREAMLPPEVREGGEKIIGPGMWRGVGDDESDQCPHSVIGVFVIGEGRGEAMRVCLAKKTCKTHWASESREAKKREKERAAAADGKSPSKPAKPVETWQEQNARMNAEREAVEAIWKKAEPIILKDFQTHMAAASVKGDGELVAMLCEELDVANPEKDESPIGILRHLAFENVAERLRNSYNREGVLKDAQKRFGFDGAKTLKEITDQEKKAAKEAEKAKAKAEKTEAAKKTAKSNAASAVCTDCGEAGHNRCSKGATKKPAKADKPKAKAKKVKHTKGASAL